MTRPLPAGWPMCDDWAGGLRGTSTPKPSGPCARSGANAPTWGASRPRPGSVCTTSSCGRRAGASVPRGGTSGPWRRARAGCRRPLPSWQAPAVWPVCMAWGNRATPGQSSCLSVGSPHPPPHSCRPSRAAGRCWPRRWCWQRALGAAVPRWAMTPRMAAVCRGPTAAMGSGKARATSKRVTHRLRGPPWKRPRVRSAAARRGRGVPNANRPNALCWSRGRRWPIHWRGRAMTACEPWCPCRSTKLLAEGEPPGGLGGETGRNNGAPPGV
jgi:hypothetical protein